MRASTELGTYYIPKGETRTIEFVQLREGQDSSREFWADDNGTLWAIVKVEQADTEGPLILKQHGANRLIRNLIVAVETDSWNPAEEAVKIGRTEAGNYQWELA